jgi:hypothetical protein
MFAKESETPMKKSQKTNRKELMKTLAAQDVKTLAPKQLEQVAGGGMCGYWPEPCSSTYCSGCQGGTRR